MLGQKVNMTRVFDAEGKNIAVTVVKILPSSVSAIKTADKDGYSAIQIKSVKEKGKKEVDLKITEFRIENADQYKVGQNLEVDLVAGESVAVQGVTKGKGFAGTIKRHGFKRGPESHGGNNVREPGSIGAQQPQRVVKGRRMAGHMGATVITVQNLKVVDIDKETILISGAIPGNNGAILRIYSK
ncbi:MAG: 50S ribosomal protein L3 [Patescibacteria group bacterium]